MNLNGRNGSITNCIFSYYDPCGFISINPILSNENNRLMDDYVSNIYLQNNTFMLDTNDTIFDVFGTLFRRPGLINVYEHASVELVNNTVLFLWC